MRDTKNIVKGIFAVNMRGDAAHCRTGRSTSST